MRHHTLDRGSSSPVVDETRWPDLRDCKVLLAVQ